MKRKALICGLFFFVILSLSGTSSVKAYSTTSVTNDPSLFVHIETAYYTDLEGKGIEDDIYSEVYIYYDTPDYYTYIDMYIDLELPSGNYYTYLVQLTIAGGNWILLPIRFYNHATESGDYILFIACWFTYSYSYDSILAMSECIFDPPGHHDEGDPPRIEIG